MPPWLEALAAFIDRGWTEDQARSAAQRTRSFAENEDEFDKLARVLHAWQAGRVPVVARLSPSRVDSWRDIPAVPVELFAAYDLFAWPVTEATGHFLSSGTTRATRGRHWHRDLRLYHASCVAGARWALGEDAVDGRRPALGWKVRSLVPADSQSSLASMIAMLERSLAPREDRDETPVLVIGPAFAYVPLIDGAHRDPLPPGSVVVETGGYKGRTREIARTELHEGIAAVYEVPPDRIIGEYGMCELSSPLWERVGNPQSSSPAWRGFAAAPWTRVRLLDPETLDDAPRGLVAVWDLANWQSSVGVRTSDIGHWNAEGRLVIEGRLAGAPAKGCSLLLGS